MTVGRAGSDQLAALFGTFSLSLSGYIAIMAQIMLMAVVTAIAMPPYTPALSFDEGISGFISQLGELNFDNYVWLTGDPLYFNAYVSSVWIAGVSTLLALISDLVEALQMQGIRKLVLLNGHGGNELKPLTRQLHHRTPVFLCVCDWYRVAADLYASIFERPGEHADEVETSMGLAFFPHLLKPELADAGAAAPTKFEAINRGWVSITRPWHLATTSTGMVRHSSAIF